jgi:hypothetical protein
VFVGAIRTACRVDSTCTESGVLVGASVARILAIASGVGVDGVSEDDG